MKYALLVMSTVLSIGCMGEAQPLEEKLQNKHSAKEHRRRYFAGEDKVICAGEYVRLGYPQPPESNYCYIWEPADDMKDEAQSFLSNPVVQPFTSTVYTVTVTDLSGRLIAREEVLVDVFLWEVSHTSQWIMSDP
jgi:hypothetical protein